MGIEREMEFLWDRTALRAVDSATAPVTDTVWLFVVITDVHIKHVDIRFYTIIFVFLDV